MNKLHESFQTHMKQLGLMEDLLNVVAVRSENLWFVLEKEIKVCSWKKLKMQSRACDTVFEII